MDHQQWQNRINEISGDLESRLDPASQNFAQRLKQAFERDFPTHREASTALTLRHHAFTHALQLYDLQSALRLIATYDLSQQATQGIVPRIQKSCNSLTVIRQLDEFAASPVELRALERYRIGVEESLQTLLKCEVQLLYEPIRLQKVVVNAPKLPEEVQQHFFIERLQSLFSRDYQTYLILKNRFFLSRIRQGLSDDLIVRWMQRRLKGSLRLGPSEIFEEVRKVDFRMVEQLVRELVHHHPGNPKLKGSPTPWHPEILKEEDGFVLDHQSAQGSLKIPISISNGSTLDDGKSKSPTEVEGPLVVSTKGEIEFDHGSEAEPVAEPIGKELEEQTGRKLDSLTEDGVDAFEVLLKRLQPLFRKITKNLKSVYSTSSPFLTPRNEDYTTSQQLEQEGFFNLEKHEIVDLREWISAILEAEQIEGARWKRKEVVQVWGNDPELDEEFLKEERSRDKDYSLKISSLMPFPLNIPTPDGTILNLEKGRRFVLQLGVAFMDRDLPERKRSQSQAKPYLRIFFKGQHLQKRGALVHLNQEPYFLALPEQVKSSMILFHLSLMMLHQSFGLTLPVSLRQHLVGVFVLNNDE
ncbi:MAG: hypothetical protein HN867_08395 [Deltaproteobacteria bacterium]|nr:hypothetical protein [Deltaproteobacteria bacterium]